MVNKDRQIVFNPMEDMDSEEKLAVLTDIQQLQCSSPNQATEEHERAFQVIVCRWMLLRRKTLESLRLRHGRNRLKVIQHHLLL